MDEKFTFTQFDPEANRVTASVVGSDDYLAAMPGPPQKEPAYVYAS